MKVLRQFTDGKGRMNMPGQPAHDDYDEKVKAKYMAKGWIGEDNDAKSDQKPKPAKPKTQPKEGKPAAPAESKPDAPAETK